MFQLSQNQPLEKHYPNGRFLIHKWPLAKVDMNGRSCRKSPFAGIARAFDRVIVTKGWSRPKIAVHD